MKIKDKTVIIACAGMGRRLKKNMPKALITIGEEPLLLRTLRCLDEVEDVRIVVGYKADAVIALAKEYRGDITFITNLDYATTNTGTSILAAAKDARQFILTIDGDIIIHPEDFARILQMKHEFVGVSEILTDDPVFTMINKNSVVGFSRTSGDYEWTGVTMLESGDLNTAASYTYELVEPRLPLPYEVIRQREIDTPHDYENALQWVLNDYQ